MNINLTLIMQAVAFAAFIWFTREDSCGRR